MYIIKVLVDQYNDYSVTYDTLYVGMYGALVWHKEQAMQFNLADAQEVMSIFENSELLPV